MVRSLSLALTLCWILPVTAWVPSTALAHEADWGEGRQPAPAPAPPTPRVPVPDRNEWPDPYAHERQYGGFVLSGGIAYFGPWDDDDRGGPGANLSAMYAFPTGHFRIGAELFHREYETQFFGVEHVDIDTYEINLLGHYVMFPGRITPYFGAGIGVHINDIDGREVARKDPSLEVDEDTGAGFGIVGLAGVEIPLSERIALFGEGRIHLSYQIVGDDDLDDSNGRNDDDTVNTGGGSGVIGIRVRF